ncbi:putative multicystatin-like isoform X2 [Capsicum annuum]|nr:putative multicystatin-like isoform X2 [Capsicum annuum]KAF3633296.1 putative multicystatin-like isoform X2 [Capsicum annuum]
MRQYEGMYWYASEDANNKFVENLTVNTSFAAGMWCYITFIATDADDLNAPKTFQALAWWGIDGKREVEFRRLKKPSD